MLSIRTALTEAFGLDVPIVLAPMGRVAGGRLAAAVSNAGGLGLVGGAYGDPEWLSQELSLVRAETDRPWGVGLITWYASPEVVELALSNRSAVFQHSVLFRDVSWRHYDNSPPRVATGGNFMSNPAVALANGGKPQASEGIFALLVLTHTADGAH